jgi:hypothetical protein
MLHPTVTFDRFVASLLFVGIVMLACLMPAQNDTWWHLRAGMDMITSRRVLLTDTFSHAVADAPWPNYEWLGEIMLAAAHRAGGMPLLTVTCAAAVAGGLAFVFSAMRGTVLMRVLLTAVVVAGATHTWSLRPQVFSQFLLGLTLWLIGRAQWKWLPIVFLVWANVHGAVAWGAVLLCGTWIGFLWRERRLPRQLVVASVLSAAATLLTPLGLNYWYEIARSVQRSKINDIAEWHAPAFLPEHPIFWIAAVVVPALLVLRRDRLTTGEQAGIAIAALLLLPLAAASLRNITPFLMVAAPAASFLLARTSTAAARQEGNPGLHLAIVTVAAASAAILVGRSWLGEASRLAWRPMSAAAARAIEGCRPALYNRYGDGGPIIFFARSQKVLIDSRQDPYPIELFSAQHEIETGADYRPLFRQYGINCAALPPMSPTIARLIAAGWITRFRDEQWIVLERPNS